MPHPNGFILAIYQFVDNMWHMEITLPDRVTGKFIWKGKTYALKPGTNNFKL
jgi:hypothetical protein